MKLACAVLHATPEAQTVSVTPTADEVHQMTKGSGWGSLRKRKEERVHLLRGLRVM